MGVFLYRKLEYCLLHLKCE